jgi:hypothetical protein
MLIAAKRVSAVKGTKLQLIKSHPKLDLIDKLSNLVSHLSRLVRIIVEHRRLIVFHRAALAPTCRSADGWLEVPRRTGLGVFLLLLVELAVVVVAVLEVAAVEPVLALPTHCCGWVGWVVVLGDGREL